MSASDSLSKQLFHGSMASIPVGGVVQDKGFVSRTGWGDGGYECVMTKTEDGELVGIDIVFISDEDEDWDESDEDED